MGSRAEELPRHRAATGTDSGGEGMDGLRPVLALAFTAVALAMAAASIALAVLKVGSFELYVILLSVGLLALAIGVIMRPSEIA